jgi:hypothetical protein
MNDPQICNLAQDVASHLPGYDLDPAWDGEGAVLTGPFGARLQFRWMTGGPPHLTVTGLYPDHPMIKVIRAGIRNSADTSAADIAADIALNMLPSYLCDLDAVTQWQLNHPADDRPLLLDETLARLIDRTPADSMLKQTAAYDAIARSKRQLMITEPDLGNPVIAEYHTDDDLARDLPPALADDAVIPRFGYCSVCGQVFPAVTGTAGQVYNALMPEFTGHQC